MSLHLQSEDHDHRESMKPPIDTDDELGRFMWECFAQAHPHEAYENWPDAFWQFFHAKCPNVSREEMEHLLQEPDTFAGTAQEISKTNR